ncbi:G2/mitotic-specific cyclin-B [Magnaporthiopsis poae ATCC 64411]|uniref:G2/mitotic-specific cyclin-B n=1 Tax=Magnaporthiopsis poae (strain ATCC 64411 / 73-15) TaxID=644358 RepID=A0A0C4E2B5_MAGP6|nr:G2/mitotic-specific cyclin-B [Magnaporthiopsis poae ATCC 64411]
MGPRTTRGRLVSNENDENAATSRVTRAKAAALNVDELALPAKAMQSKRATTTTQGTARTRAALGDVSNVTKVEVHDGKKVAGKAGLVSKAAQPSGVQKATTRAATGRTALSSKQVNQKVETKRSGPGAIPAQKRKVSQPPANSITVKEEAPAESEPVRKKVPAPEPVKAKPAKKEPEPEVPEAKPFVRPDPREEVARNLPPGVHNLENDDFEDPLMVAEYANEIFDYMLDLETRSMPNPDYMSHQDDLEWKTRGILVDWLIEVHTRFHLVPETLFLAVNIVDRFLSEKVVPLDRLQLVGITAMFIASKYEEVMSPHVTNFRHVTDDGFSESEILSAERYILQTLKYDLSYPNPMNFLRRISKADNYDVNSRTVGKYLMEISLLDHRLMQFRPSHIAAAAMALSRIILDRGEWDETLAHYSGYTDEEVEPVVHLMLDYLSRPIIHEAFFKKYASKRFLKTSIFTRNWTAENGYLFGITATDVSIDQLE